MTAPALFSLDSITVGERHRRDMGDIPALAASIASVGLLHPVVITPNGVLIAGERRIEACRRLGLSAVPVHVVDIDAISRGEFAENAHRKDFAPSELVAIAATVEQRERELAQRRMTLGKISTGSERGKVRDKVAAPLGVSGRTLEKAKAVVHAAEAEPERFGHLVREMDARAGGVTSAHRKLSQARDEQKVLGLTPVAGKYRSLVIDPPWRYDDDLMGRGPPEYATMTHEELLALDVGQWAEDNCHLYLWVTNAFVPHAVELMARWGFQHNTMLTWAKPHFGMGAHFRGQTEHVMFGIKGTLGTRRKDISTLFEAPVGKHSEKPEEFYEIVRRASYPPYGEAFQRQARPGFANLFEQQSAKEGLA
jgi:N6-adenosine-specific RNA methylase IME4